VVAFPKETRLSELVATISLGTDLGLGQPMEHVIRQTIIALRLAELLGLSEAERGVTYYAGLLAWVGCHTDAYEQAKWFGDDLMLKRNGFAYDTGRPVQAASFALNSIGAGASLLHRARLWAGLPLAVKNKAFVDLRTHWMGADQLAEQLQLGDDVRQSLRESFERWDGRGAFGAVGSSIRLTSRLINLADVVAVFHASGGVSAAIAVARERSSTQFDPELVELFCANADDLTADLDRDSNWEHVIAAEPQLARVLTAVELDEALEAIGDFADIKSPFTIGHSRAVARMAGEAAASTGMGAPGDLRRAGWLHDLGRLGVPNTIWDKPGRLTVAEMERVRLHPYLTERMLASTPALARLGAIAVQHHERLDGSGYPRGLTGSAVTVEGRVLAAADLYATMIEERPHRPALPPSDAAARLREEVRAGRIDGGAADGVLQAAGHRIGRRRDWPGGLTTREVEVLRLLTRGLTNKLIAERLFISRSTVGSHTEHIYAKTGATNRATLGLFAMRHGLMSDL
jgi:HD-GYP domain-containing protein (c-di-GMP phosphodiesterase class II)/DNA-binding CsgD family transcriptional regulator